MRAASVALDELGQAVLGEQVVDGLAEQRLEGTAPYRPTPTAAGCTTLPTRRTWWPRPASRRSPTGETSPRPHDSRNPPRYTPDRIGSEESGHMDTTAPYLCDPLAHRRISLCEFGATASLWRHRTLASNE